MTESLIEHPLGCANELQKRVFKSITRIPPKGLHNVSPQVAREMLNQTTGDRLRHKIWDNMTHNNVSYYARSFSDADYGTTHVAVLAPNGDAVSVTTTINRR